MRSRIYPGDGDARHGTTNGYFNLRCRCADCRASFSSRKGEEAARRKTEAVKSMIRADSVADSHGCWIWQRFTDSAGYGRATLASSTVFVHRLSYLAFVGPIPDGHHVDHICFQTSCVNPEHLQALPAIENLRRQRSALATHCKRGHEFTPENTSTGPGGTGRRRCKTCKGIRNAARSAVA